MLRNFSLYIFESDGPEISTVLTACSYESEDVVMSSVKHLLLRDEIFYKVTLMGAIINSEKSNLLPIFEKIIAKLKCLIADFPVNHKKSLSVKDLILIYEKNGNFYVLREKNMEKNYVAKYSSQLIMQNLKSQIYKISRKLTISFVHLI